jgi:hypothetical protein
MADPTPKSYRWVPPIAAEGGCENSRKNARIFAQEKVFV